MVYCYAYDCKNDHKSGKSTFGFPPNTLGKKELRRKWIAACNRRKKDVENAKYPRLCEDHFSPDAFSKIPDVARQLGCRLDLKPDAVPDPERFSGGQKNLSSSPGYLVPTSQTKTGTKRKSLAFQKRRNLEIIADYDERNKKLAEAEGSVSQSTDSRDPSQTEIAEPGTSSVSLGDSQVPSGQSADSSGSIAAENAGHSVDSVVATCTLVNMAHPVVDASFTAANAGHSSADARFTGLNMGNLTEDPRFTAVNMGQCTENSSINAVNVGCPAQEMHNEVKLEVKPSGYGDSSDTDTSSESGLPSLAVQVPSIKKVSVATQTSGLMRVKGCQTNSMRYHGIQMIDAESPQTMDQGCDPVFPPEIQLIGVLPSQTTIQ